MSSFLDLRGRNLIWAMEQLFKQISPESAMIPKDPGKTTFSAWTKLFRARFARASVAEEIAHAIANHPALWQTPASLAAAIRPHELQDILQAIRDGKGRKPFDQLDPQVQQQINNMLRPVEDLNTDIQGVSGALSSIDQLVTEKAEEVKKILNAAVTATSRAAIDRVMAEVKMQAADKLEAIAKKVQEEIQKATVLERGVEKWFNTVMDHACARFVKHNRLATPIIAIMVTLFFRIELRAKLVNTVDGAMNLTLSPLFRIWRFFLSPDFAASRKHCPKRSLNGPR